jgi:predicted outer membrane repeat protein
MNTGTARFLFGAIIGGVMAITLLARPMPARAGGIVTTCDYGNFVLALGGGGTVTFNCNGNHSPGTINFNDLQSVTITQTTTIDGSNGGSTIVFGDVADSGTRYISLTNGVALTLTNIILAGGADFDGGCIYDNGALVLDNVQFINCIAYTGTRGGAVYVSNTGSAAIANSQVLSNTAYLSGGGVYSLGSLTVTNSYFAYNHLPSNASANDGGAIWAAGNTRIEGSTFFSNTAFSNTAGHGYGGGIYNQGTFSMTNSTVSSNRAKSGGGGIQTYSGTTTLQNVTVISNSVSGTQSGNGGGGLLNAQGTLVLNNVTVNSNYGWFGGGIGNAGTATMSNVTVNSNNGEYGGGIRNQNSSTLTLTNSSIIGNSSNAQGGGIYNQGFATLLNLSVSGNHSYYIGGGINNEGSASMTNLVVTNNTATTEGGGISGAVSLVNSTVSGNSSYDGGGLLGVSVLWNSTVSGNTATNNGGGVWTSEPTYIMNSTISGNHAHGDGGGIYVNSYGTNLYNVTVTGNQANSDASGGGLGGGVKNAGGTFDFVDSIIAGNFYAYLFGGFPVIDYEDCSGAVNADGYNIMYVTTDCTISGSVTLADPVIGPLQNNGGPTQTHSPLIGSPAIDAGDPTGCKDYNGAVLSVDQRGLHRPVNGHVNGTRCDIGAVEFYSNSLFLPLILR